MLEKCKPHESAHLVSREIQNEVLQERMGICNDRHLAKSMDSWDPNTISLYLMMQYEVCIFASSTPDVLPSGVQFYHLYSRLTLGQLLLFDKDFKNNRAWFL